ncbi:MAG: type IX secretion system sortase PorU [Prolixibacteraceae bacterium]|nr:type IX secretion system sortase PorU [Prolixibacteraceae bacterium]
MSRLIFLYTLIFFTLTSWATDFNRTIHWTNQGLPKVSANKSLPDFDGSITAEPTKLPLWFESFELTSADADLAILNSVFEIVGDSVLQSNQLIPAELKYWTEIGSSSGKSFLRLTINPFVRINNRIEKLVEFTVSIQEKPLLLKSAKAAYAWKSSSVLATGKWTKIKTKTKGIYKITYDQLKAWGYSNPDQVSMYGNGGYMLPTLNSELKFDDLVACPIFKAKDNAGKDCIFFYSTGNIQISQDSDSGNLKHQQNYYATESYFYLSDQGAAKIIGKAAELTAPAGKQVFSFPNYSFSEKELLNLISSGSQWFGEHFIAGSSQTINFTLDYPDQTKPAVLKVSVAGKSSSSNSINVSLNGKSVNNISFQTVDVSDPTVYFADDRIVEFTEAIPSKALQLKLTYNALNSSSDAWLDYLSINYQSLLNISSDVFSFRGKGVDGQVQVSEFVLNGAAASVKVFDVTDWTNVIEVPATIANEQLKFKSNSSLLREYVAFNPVGTIPSPELVGVVANQNLHAEDLSELIIVAHPSLLSAANDLATFHRTNDKMSVKVITPELIYNEFSGGLPDPSGIRNYFRMCYDRGKQSGKNTLKYVLFMGDGTYDNRNILGKNLNMIPTFQSDNSLSPTESFVTDDFYAFLDENEGGYSGTVDLGIGRIPARTIDEAEIVIDKIRNYHKRETMGNWRDVVTFIGDDQDNSTHMGQAESLANFVNNTYPAFFTDKIYFDAFRQISTSGGEKYPDVTTAINNRVKQGTLVMNYTGHANEKNLADENVLDVGIISAWTNYDRLPIFVTATCEFSRFDSNETSAGEHILFNPVGGGVGLFSTTRLVYSGANFVLNSKFFRYIFEKDLSGNNLRLGDVMRLAKASANTGINQLNFTLLADPAMRLANPNFQVKTTSVDGKNAATEVDTIRPLSVVTIKGFVADNNGVKLSTFNGEIIPTVYDKAMQVKTLGNAGEEQMDYNVQNNIIYRGLATVKNGDFEFSFFVPKDISYKIDKGKILYYAYNDSVDAQGYFNGFYIGGSSNTSIADSKGPDIELFMNSESFKDGGVVNASSILIAHIKDDTGINTAGTGIGHDITAVLDGDNSNVMVLNDYFQASKDKYTEGTIVFPLNNLEEGSHTLTIKVWDVLNNSSEKEIHFVVKDDFRIESVICYPNPVQEQTSFVFEHNQPDESFTVDLEVFESSGARVDMVSEKISSRGTESSPLEWTPASRLVKMRPGVYVYRILVTNSDGKTGSASGRFVFIRP